MVLGWTIKIPVMMIKLHQPTPIETRNSVAFFEDVSDMYDPTSDWLDGMIPAHPSFGKDAQIQDILTSVKGFLLNKILDGCLELVQDVRYQSIDMFSILNSSLHKNTGLWQAIVSTQKYGVIYLCSRSDARNIYLELLQKNPHKAQLVNNFLSQDSAAIRAINYGVHQYIHDATICTTLARKFVPPYAIAAIG